MNIHRRIAHKWKQQMSLTLAPGEATGPSYKTKYENPQEKSNKWEKMCLKPVSDDD